MKNNSVEMAEEAIRKAVYIQEQLFASQEKELSAEDDPENPDCPADFSVERLEEGVEHVHRVAQINRNEAAEQLRRRLEMTAHGRIRTRCRRLAALAGAAAVIVVLVGIYWLHNDNRRTATIPPVVKLEKITVPTLFYEQNEKVVASQPLTLKNAGSLYVAEEPAEEAIVSQKVIIPEGYTYTVKLADGSTVMLNAGSELRYASRFDDTVRLVELKGEAYFHVAASDVPFVVKAGDTQVKVYGTQFNLLYAEALGVSEAVLVEGKIGMSAGGQEIKILPNQRIYRKSGASMQVEHVDPADYIAWTNNSFKYNAARLDRIVYDISRWYGIKIELAPELSGQPYSLEFDKSATAEWALRALEMIVGRNIKKEGGVYHLK